MASISVTTVATTEVKVDNRAQQMMLARCEEFAKLDREIKEREGRQERIKKELAELAAKAGFDDTLDDGVEIHGHRIKRVKGTNRTLDTKALMKAVGIDKEELDAFYDEKPKKAYLKITAPGKRDGEE